MIGKYFYTIAALAAPSSLLPLWEKVARTKFASDEGLLGDGVCGYPSPVSNRFAVRSTLSHKGRGEEEAARQRGRVGVATGDGACGNPTPASTRDDAIASSLVRPTLPARGRETISRRSSHLKTLLHKKAEASLPPHFSLILARTYPSRPAEWASSV